MSAAHQAREPYSPYRFTAQEFFRMADAAILAEDDHVEPIDGHISVKEPAAPEHAGHGVMLEQMFHRLLGDRVLVCSQYPLHIDELNNPEPDIAIVKPRDDFYVRAHPRASDVLLLVEIAWTSGRGDRSIKAPLYGRAGIPEFWLVGIPSQTLEVYREPSESGYGTTKTLSRQDRVSPLAFPDVEIDAADVLRPL